MFFALLIFRGIYFLQFTKRQWSGLLWSNRASLMRILKEAYQAYRRSRASPRRLIPTCALASSSGNVS